jgi:hypothetical protein
MKRFLSFSFLLKFFIALLAFGFVFYKMKNFYMANGSIFPAPWIQSLHILIPSLVGLMILNWFLESIKWRKLLETVEKISCRKSFHGVLAGITLGLLTPKRIGDVGGRCLMLKKSSRKKGVLAFGVSSVLQSTVTLLFGLVALIVFAGFNFFSFKQELVLIISAIVLLLLLIWIILNLPKISTWLGKMPFLVSQQETLNFLQKVSFVRLAEAFLFSFLRYVVFSFQLYLLIRFTGVTLSFAELFAGIGLTYLLMSFFPLSSIAELGVRGSVAAFVFGWLLTDTGGVIMSVFGIWIINLALPGLWGAMLIFFTRSFNMKKINLHQRSFLNLNFLTRSNKKL